MLMAEPPSGEAIDAATDYWGVVIRPLQARLERVRDEYRLL